MRLRSFRAAVWGPFVFAATAVIAFAAAPVHADPPPQANPSWGDITSVQAGAGLSGGALTGDAVLSVIFGGNGTANTAARSDHNHAGLYAPLVHSHDGGGDHLHDDRYMLNTANFDDRYWMRTENFDDRYSPLGHGHDAEYAALNHDHDALYSALGHNHDALYLGLGGGTLNGLLTMTVGDLTLLGNGARVLAPQLVSTAAEGTAPLEVTSSTLVNNLNADKLDGHDASDFALAGSGGACSDCALLSGSNAFTGVNTFNAGTTFAAPVGLAAGGATFTWQPSYTSTTNYNLRLIDSRVNATRLVLDQNGRIGIGTTSPTSPLHVVGNVRASGLDLGSALLGPTSFDMASAADRTFSILNSNGGVGHLSVEGNVTAAGLSIPTGGGAATAGFDMISESNTTRTVSTTAITGTSLLFVTPDGSRAGCSAVPGFMYVSARSAGANFTVTVAGPAPGAGENYCFNWWVLS